MECRTQFNQSLNSWNVVKHTRRFCGLALDTCSITQLKRLTFTHSEPHLRLHHLPKDGRHLLADADTDRTVTTWGRDGCLHDGEVSGAGRHH